MRRRRLQVVVGVFLFLSMVIVASPVAFAQGTDDVEMTIRKAQKDSANVMVVLDVKDKYYVFSVTGLAEVAKNKITIRKGVFVIGEGEGKGSPDKLAVKFLDQWKQPPESGNFTAKWDDETKSVISFAHGGLKEDLKLEVKKVLLVSKKE